MTGLRGRCPGYDMVLAAGAGVHGRLHALLVEHDADADPFAPG